MYYPSGENKGADQLCSYCTADLRLCFRIGKVRFSHDAAPMAHDKNSKRECKYNCKIYSFKPI